jgi:hypothetical protein
MPQRFVLTSRWRLHTPAAAAWRLLTEVEAWPAWWRYVRRVRRVRIAPGTPLGDVTELHWGSALPYDLCLRVTTVAALAPHRLEGHAQGDLQGIGTWVLEPVDGIDAVDITYRWEVVLQRRWMRALAWLLRPLFEWNHFVVMRAGAQGMAHALGCQVSQLHEWAGHARA